MIQRADTVGVFQIESRAQMAMLPRLKPACFYDLVIEVAIVRPGPIQGNMVHPYLRRRDGAEPVTYPSAAVRDVLHRTLGVPIFQEQVMKLAVVAAGFTPGEADQLRRSMAAWRRKGGLEKFEQKLIDGMGERGYAEEFARQIFAQIQGFGEYGFPESHAASFALLVYVSAWLKHYEPAAFTCALLNSQPMGFYAPAQLIQDARKHGVEVLPVDVTVSGWESGLEQLDMDASMRGLSPSTQHERETSGGISSPFILSSPRSGRIEGPDSPLAGVSKDLSRSRSDRIEGESSRPNRDQFALRLGLHLISGLSTAGAQRIAAARTEAPFRDIEDLARRAQLNRRDLRALADAGALASLSGHRRRALWAVAGIESASPLLDTTRIAEGTPLLKSPTEGENIVADYASLGLTIGRHPLAVLRALLNKRHVLTAEQVRARVHGSFAHTAGLVICRQHPSSANGVIFVTLEDETGVTNLVVWNALAQRQRRELLQSRLLGVIGEVQRDGEVLHVIAKRLVDYSPLLGRLVVESRDFR
jgi:error-prone DNA polymerase